MDVTGHLHLNLIIIVFFFFFPLIFRLSSRAMRYNGALIICSLLHLYGHPNERIIETEIIYYKSHLTVIIDKTIV